MPHTKTWVCNLLVRWLDNEADEEKVRKCGSVRKLAKKTPGLKDSTLDSVASVKVLLNSITQILELKGRKFVVDVPATESTICDVWSSLQELDPTFDLGPSDKIRCRMITKDLQYLTCVC